MQPASPDAHTSESISGKLASYVKQTANHFVDLASAYIISDTSRPDLALQHLRSVKSLLTMVRNGWLMHRHSIASSLAPEDPEIAFNLAAVLEACKSSH